MVSNSLVFINCILQVGRDGSSSGDKHVTERVVWALICLAALIFSIWILFRGFPFYYQKCLSTVLSCFSSILYWLKNVLRIVCIETKAAYSLSLGNHPHPHAKMAIFRPFQGNFLPSFTKLFYRWSFWGAERVCISIDSIVMTQNANIFFWTWLLTKW